MWLHYSVKGRCFPQLIRVYSALHMSERSCYLTTAVHFHIVWEKQCIFIVAKLTDKFFLNSPLWKMHCFLCVKQVAMASGNPITLLVGLCIVHNNTCKTNTPQLVASSCTVWFMWPVFHSILTRFSFPRRLRRILKYCLC